MLTNNARQSLHLRHKPEVNEQLGFKAVRGRKGERSRTVQHQQEPSREKAEGNCGVVRDWRWSKQKARLCQLKGHWRGSIERN